MTQATQHGKPQMRCPKILHEIAEDHRESGETKGEALARYVRSLRDGDNIREFKDRFRNLSDEEQLLFMKFAFTHGNPIEDMNQQVTA